MRYEGIAKMGFYATPPTMTTKILRRLSFAGPARLCDPCCGEGVALSQVGQAAFPGSITYGVELDGKRAERAKAVLDHCVHCGYEFARVEPASMQFIWLNPPYDENGGQGGLGNRKELIFLRDTSKWVEPGGVLVFIIPGKVLGKDLVDALVQRYTDLGIYRFDSEEYMDYEQVVIFGHRRSSLITRVKDLSVAEQNARNDLLACGQAQNPYDMLPALDTVDGRIWTVPATDVSMSIEFRGYLLDEEELALDLEGSEVFRVAGNMLADGMQQATLKRPLLPFKRTHLATLISAGVLNGAIGIGESRHMVVGITRKKIETETVQDDGGNETVIQTESFATVVRTVEADGTITDLQ